MSITTKKPLHFIPETDTGLTVVGRDDGGMNIFDEIDGAEAWLHLPTASKV